MVLPKVKTQGSSASLLFSSYYYYYAKSPAGLWLEWDWVMAVKLVISYPRIYAYP